VSHQSQVKAFSFSDTLEGLRACRTKRGPAARRILIDAASASATAAHLDRCVPAIYAYAEEQKSWVRFPSRVLLANGLVRGLEGIELVEEFRDGAEPAFGDGRRRRTRAAGAVGGREAPLAA
jgi:hypothetical protein